MGLQDKFKAQSMTKAIRLLYILVVEIGLTALAIGCSSPASTTFSDQSYSQNATILFESYRSNAENAAFNKVLAGLLAAPDLKAHQNLPESETVAGILVHDFNKKVKKISSAGNFNFSGTLGEFFSLTKIKGSKLNIKDFQLAEEYAVDLLWSIDDEVKMKLLYRKYTPEQMNKSAYVAVITSALTSANTKKDSLSLASASDIVCYLFTPCALVKGTGELIKAVSKKRTCNMQAGSCKSAQENLKKNDNKKDDIVQNNDACMNISPPSCTHGIARSIGEIAGGYQCSWRTWSCDCREKYVKVNDDYKHSNDSTEHCETEDKNKNPPELVELNRDAYKMACVEQESALRACGQNFK
ncbi:MAG: hypothetical protein NTY08_06525 [Proteobacteria bacterium]|nr:hypothetical protein [Pseudomonadota bacterium]